ncbi:MAG TPA: class I SAM-dependent methyltransferase [Nitrospirota bacterium]
MNAEDIKKNAAELFSTLIQAGAALTTIQGIEIGFFDRIPVDKSITAEELSGQMGFDITRVERWLQFAVKTGLISKSPAGYTLTPKGSLLRQDTPAPDLLGLYHLVGYFTKAVHYSRDAYKKGTGLDSITDLKFSREYIPRVASQLSRASAECFKRFGVSTGHTILDLGCGDGSVLRETVRTCPGVSATGIDINVHTLDLAREKNEEFGLQDQIELFQGDVTALSGIRDGAYDWVYSVNVLPYLPAHKRDAFLREMVRISRYGVFFNQVIKNNIETLSGEIMLSTMFSDFTGFFTEAEAEAFIRNAGVKHRAFLPIIQGESRMVAMFTSKNDVPLSRFPSLNERDRGALASANIHSAKDLLTADPAPVSRLGFDVDAVRGAAIKLLFP